jgi:hypothetical protein
LQRLIGKSFAFDCVGLAKAIAWEWNANWNHARGGSRYGINGVSDQTSTGMFNRSSDISTDFSSIQVGEAVHMIGHIGFYIGDGKVIEATPIWADGVQVSNLSQRNWLRHGKLYFVDYTSKPEWEMLIDKYTDSPMLWKRFMEDISYDSLGRWFPDFLLKLNDRSGRLMEIDSWEEIIMLQMGAGREWINFINKHKDHTVGRWLPHLVVKIYNGDGV